MQPINQLVSVTNDLICVGPNDLDRTWPLVAHLFKSAYAEMDMMLPDVLSWLKDGQGLLWIVADETGILTALTTSIEERPSGRTLLLVANGGEGVERWKHHLAEIEAYYAKEQNCVKVRCIGRQGWARTLPGFVIKAVSLERAIVCQS